MKREIWIDVGFNMCFGWKWLMEVRQYEIGKRKDSWVMRWAGMGKKVKS